MVARYQTIADLQGKLDPQKNLAPIAEVVARSSHMMADAPLLEGNLETGNRSVQRTGIPQGQWRSLYGGVMPEKSTTKTVTDSCGLLESYSEVDKALVKMAPNPAQFRMDEEMTFVEGMAITAEDTMWYGDTRVDPEKFMGLTPRYGQLAGAATSENVISVDGVGTGNGGRTSLWLVTWDPSVAFMFYGKGFEGGFQSENLGQDTKVLADGSQFEIVRSHFLWNLGFALRDWRYCVRIGNIKVDGSGELLTPHLIRAVNKLPTMGKGQKVIYGNQDAITKLDIERQGNDVSGGNVLGNINLTLGEWGGDATTFFRGIPIRKADALINSELDLS